MGDDVCLNEFSDVKLFDIDMFHPGMIVVVAAMGNTALIVFVHYCGITLCKAEIIENGAEELDFLGSNACCNIFSLT